MCYGKETQSKNEKVSGVSRKKETRKVELKKEEWNRRMGESVEGVIYDGQQELLGGWGTRRSQR